MWAEYLDFMCRTFLKCFIRKEQKNLNIRLQKQNENMNRRTLFKLLEGIYNCSSLHRVAAVFSSSICKEAFLAVE